MLGMFREYEERLGALEDSEEEKYIVFDLKGVTFPEANWDPWVPAVGCVRLVKIHQNGILSRRPAGVRGTQAPAVDSCDPVATHPCHPLG